VDAARARFARGGDQALSTFLPDTIMRSAKLVDQEHSRAAVELLRGPTGREVNGCLRGSFFSMPSRTFLVVGWRGLRTRERRSISFVAALHPATHQCSAGSLGMCGTTGPAGRDALYNGQLEHCGIDER